MAPELTFRKCSPRTSLTDRPMRGSQTNALARRGRELYRRLFVDAITLRTNYRMKRADAAGRQFQEALDRVGVGAIRQSDIPYWQSFVVQDNSPKLEAFKRDPEARILTHTNSTAGQSFFFGFAQPAGVAPT